MTRKETKVLAKMIAERKKALNGTIPVTRSFELRAEIAVLEQFIKLARVAMEEGEAV